MPRRAPPSTPPSNLPNLSFALFALVLVGCPVEQGTVVPHDAGRDGDASDARPFVPDECKLTLGAGNQAVVTVGQGQTFYADLADDQTLTWEKGPQGGHHVWIAIRETGLHRQGTITTIDVADVEHGTPAPIASSRVIFDLSRDEGGYCTLSGLRTQLDVPGAPPLSSLIGHHLAITVTLVDVDGSTASGTKRIIVTGDPG